MLLALIVVGALTVLGLWLGWDTMLGQALGLTILLIVIVYCFVLAGVGYGLL